ncbi:MAG: acyl carrier protein [Deltaproteobacteria bacterium]|nr:acyl carrier protein [Deltaproteobacteria bacterium]
MTDSSEYLQVKPEVFEAVRACIAESLMLEPGDIAMSSRLIDDLGADSLDFVDIVFQLERDLSVKVRGSEFEWLTRLDFSSPEVMQEGFLTAPVVEQLVSWLPALRELEDHTRISPRALFSLITVEAMCLVAQRRMQSPST